MNSSARHPCPTVLPQGNPDQLRSTLSRRYEVCQGDSCSHAGAVTGNSDGGVAVDPQHHAGVEGGGLKDPHEDRKGIRL